MPCQHLPAIGLPETDIAGVLIRNVDDVLHGRLKASAAARQEVTRRENVVSLAKRLLGPEMGLDLGIPRRDLGRERSPPTYSEGGGDRRDDA